MAARARHVLPPVVRSTCYPSSEKINIDFVCETVNFYSLNLIILKKKSGIRIQQNITISSFLGFE